MAIVLAVVLLILIAGVSILSRGGAVSNQRAAGSFFEQFVIAGGPIVWFILLPMSVVTIFLAVEHCLTIGRRKLLPDGIDDWIIEIIRNSSPGEWAEQIAARDDFVSVAVVQATAKSRGDWLRMRNAVAESLQDQAWLLMRKIEWINLIGNVSPMVGLFGTVYGMIKLFNAIVTAGGQPQPAHLEGGISVALVTPFWGLFIAIPALALYGVFRNRIETLVSEAVVETDNIMLQIRRTLKSNSQAAQKVSAKPAGGSNRSS